ncbi:MAG: VWA domain-containing protein [Chloroflexi bacterium]|nr:VWA domain-containing protein [Chloroflexota bacterium]
MIAFCRLLRDRDLAVSPAEAITALETARSIDLADRHELKLALRSVLTSCPEDLPVFDVSFEEFWQSRVLEGGDDHFTTREAGASDRGPGQHQMRVELDAPAGSPRRAPDEQAVSAPVSSPVETLAYRDFGSFRPEELPDIRRAIALLARKLATRASRRYRTASTGRQIDLRRSFRRNIQYGGTLVQLAHRRRRIHKQRVVLICDVSRSMEAYSVFLLQFIYALHDVLGRVDSFVFSTRLTRVTEYFSHHTIELALEQIAREAPDWAGGTRIGDSLHTFNTRWARQVLGPHTVVLIVSDGLDSGHWSVLQREVIELEQRAERLIWLNPALGRAGYRPVARGMAVALPHVSLFASAHNLASLKELAANLTR